MHGRKIGEYVTYKFVKKKVKLIQIRSLGALLGHNVEHDIT